ncbi:MAG: Asp-tRNA(Asn)/Glu-tRNA(Gln) amidotransferase subunit GatB [Bacilli bacterium]|jgi:aspartyl-tRNA(Asn)/glutamyl-tRNA(Gln) amidotransferase subunit B|nr:Asp-tRNA(Asn)/Glu-tRNA(Gln) amidotransferase subunit GatB [Bacilli bacterium]
MKYKVIIGLEIHVEMKTRSKMFSSVPVEFGAEPNTLVSVNDLGFPGTLPTVNKQAVINAIQVANALNMQIERKLIFDRKNYFYSDLPKGYQISQDKNPIGFEGYLDLRLEEEIKRVRIERLHLEEDTAKQLHFDDYTLIDYNRAGVPLIEIVSYPEITSGIEAMKYVEMIRAIVVYLDVSDGKMEEGSLRCDVNISLANENEKFGTKVEIKNLNSISNIEKAINYEIARQEELLSNNEIIIPETRRYDDVLKETVVMRQKGEDSDYKLFIESNILPITLSEDFISEAIKSSPELPHIKEKRYLEQYLISERDSNIILANKHLAFFFDEVAKHTTHYQALANWLVSDVLSFINKNNLEVKSFPIKAIELAKLINLVEKKELSHKQGRDLFFEMATNYLNVDEAKEKLNISGQINDENLILKYVNEVLDNNPQSIQDYLDGKSKALGFLVGQVMKLSHGKVNPSLTSTLLLKELNKRIKK